MDNQFIQHLTSDIDSDQLNLEIQNLIDTNKLYNKPQITLTSMSGEDDFFCSTGRREDLLHPEIFYNTPLNCLSGTYTESVIKQFPSYCRWRVLIIPPCVAYSIHSDKLGESKNYRIHIPIKTNHMSYLMFFEPHIYRNSQKQIYTRRSDCAHLLPNNAYDVDVSGLHSAVNFGSEHRIHLVGVRYE